MFRDSFQRLLKRANRAQRPGPAAVSLFRTFLKAFPGAVSMVFFDGQGRVFHQEGSRESRVLAERLWHLLMDFRTGKGPLNLQNQPVFASFLGLPRLDQRFNELGTTGWFETSGGPRKTCFFHQFGPKVSVFAFFHSGNFTGLSAVRRVLPRFQTRRIRVDLVDAGSRELPDCRDQGFRRIARQAFGLLSGAPLSRLLDGKRAWATAQITPDRFLLASTEHDPQGRRDAFLRIYLLAGVFLFLASWALVTHLMTAQPPPFLSIRWKVVGIFILVGGLPLLLLVLLAGGYVREHRDLLIAEAVATEFRVLDELEERFPQIRLHFERLVNRVVERHTALGKADLPRLAREVRDVLGQNAFRGLRVVDSSGGGFLILPPGQTDDPSTGGFMKKMLGFLLHRARGEVRTEDKTFLMELGAGPGPVESEQADMVVEHLLGNFGKLLPLFVGRTETNVLVHRIGPARKLPDSLLAAQWSQEDLRRAFCRRFVPMKPLENGVELLTVGFRGRGSILFSTKAGPEETSTASSSGRDRGLKPFLTSPSTGDRLRRVRRVFPCFPSRPLSGQFLKVFQTVRRRGVAQTAIVPYKTGKAIVAGRPGKALEGAALFAILPLAAIEDELALMRSRIHLFAVLGLGFSTLIGIILGRKFLRPVSEITHAVELVASGKFGHRIPQQDPDELGTFSERFNSMAEQLEEVSLARRIQKNLLPSGPLFTDRFALAGASTPATDLGGDYFDYLQFPDGRLMAIHGDVAGHGMPAALIMAMVKGLVNLALTSRAPATDLLDALSGVIHRSGNRGSGMTLAVLDIDPAREEVIVYNCGNPFPVLRRADGSVSLIEARGMILGVREKHRATPVRVALNTGDRLILYSDGLFESFPASQGNGHKAFVAYLAGLSQLPLEEFCGAVLSMHPIVMAGGNLPDDVTLLVCERLGTASSRAKIVPFDRGRSDPGGPTPGKSRN